MLYKLEMNFDIYGVKETQKVTVASNHMSGEVDTFFHYLLMKNNGTSPSWSEFKGRHYGKVWKSRNEERIIARKTGTGQILWTSKDGRILCRVQDDRRTNL
jgi:hypothetical protein